MIKVDVIISSLPTRKLDLNLVFFVHSNFMKSFFNSLCHLSNFKNKSYKQKIIKMAEQSWAMISESSFRTNLQTDLRNYKSTKLTEIKIQPKFSFSG